MEIKMNMANHRKIVYCTVSNGLVSSKVAFVFCLLLSCVTCGKIELGPPISSFDQICVVDNGNTGNASDIEVNLDSKRDAEHVSEYRFFMLKEKDRSNFTIDDAEQLRVDRFHAFVPIDVIKIMGTVLPASFKDVDGDIIRADEIYSTGILTVSIDEELVSNSLFISDQPFSLSDNTLISTFTQSFGDTENVAAGSLTVFQQDLIMGAYNIQDELSISTLQAPSPIQRMGRTGGNSLLLEYSGLLGGNAFDSNGNLFQSVISKNEVLKIDPDGEIKVINTLQSSIRQPDGIYINDADEVFIVGRGSSTILKIDSSGQMESYATIRRRNPKGITGDADGNLYISHNVEEGYITRIGPDKSEKLLAQIPTYIPSDYILDYFMWVGYLEFLNGHVYVAGMSTDIIYKINVENGEIENWAGSGQRGFARGDIKKANLNRPNGISVSSDQSRLYISGTTDVTPIHVQYSTPPIIWEILFDDD